jgi:hypothetical protein
VYCTYLIFSTCLFILTILDVNLLPFWFQFILFSVRFLSYVLLCFVLLHLLCLLLFSYFLYILAFIGFCIYFVLSPCFCLMLFFWQYFHRLILLFFVCLVHVTPFPEPCFLALIPYQARSSWCLSLVELLQGFSFLLICFVLVSFIVLTYFLFWCFRLYYCHFLFILFLYFCFLYL